MAKIMAYGKQILQAHGTLMQAYSKESSKKPGQWNHYIRIGLVGSALDVHYRAATPELVDALHPYEGSNVILTGDAVIDTFNGNSELKLGGQIAAFLVNADGTTTTLYSPEGETSGRRRAA